MSEESSNRSLSDQSSVEDGWEKWSALTTEAYVRFHKQLTLDRPKFFELADYVPLRRAEEARGTFAWKWSATAEIRETINNINSWAVRLHEWRAWNSVLESYKSESEKWDVLFHFIEPVAFYCMLQPSSLSDRFMLSVETALHQANCFVLPEYPDRLDQDDLAKGRYMSRKDRLRQLNRIGSPWDSFPMFRDHLSKMNGREYRVATGSFRNLSSHAFPARWMVGHVNRAIRSIVQWQEMEEQAGGGFLPVDHPTKKAVQYAMQSLEPISLDAAHALNSVEYKRALSTMKSLGVLVSELSERADSISKSSHSANQCDG